MAEASAPRFVRLVRLLMLRLDRMIRLLGLARISAGLLLLGVLALTMSQGLDVVRGLVDSANVYIRSGELTSPEAWLVWLQWAAFLIACIWSGINAWYWPRLLYALRQRPLRRYFLVTVRLLGVVPLLTGCVSLIVVARTSDVFRSVWIGLLIFVAATIAMEWLLWSRKRLFMGPRGQKRWYAQRSRWLDRIQRRLGKRGEMDVVRGDDVFVLCTLAAGLVMLLLTSIPIVRTQVAWYLGSAALAFGAIGTIIAMVSFLAWLADRLRFPVLTAGVLAFVLFSFTNDNHAVRVLPGTTLDARPTVEQALRIWERTAGSGPLILVAAAGGASRAAYWTGAVLRALDDRTAGRFSQHVFAISAVSGGSLGAVGYAAWIADHPPGRCAYDPLARYDFDRAFLGDDYLAPAVGGLLYPDAVQRFVPVPIFSDRAASLEEGWEVRWRRAARSGAAAAAPRCAPLDRSNRMAEDYLGLWRDSFAGRAPWVPMVLVNGTLVENGKRIITAPVRVEPATFEDSLDFFAIVPRPIRASTAILNGARFPVVSPAGTLRGPDGPHGRIVDGGYFENGGLETLYDLARYIHALPGEGGRKIIIIEIANDVPVRADKASAARNDVAASADLDRYGNVRRPGETLLPGLSVDPPPRTGAPPLSEITSILDGLYRTRTSRGVLAAKRISGLGAIGFGGDARRVTFNLARLTPAGTTMSWSLSLSSRDAMDLALDPNHLAGKGMKMDRRVDAFDLAKSPSVACERMAADQIATAVDGRPRAPTPGCDVGGGIARRTGVPLDLPSGPMP